MSKKFNKLICFFIIKSGLISAMAPINLFRPADRFLLPQPRPWKCFQLNISYEGTLKIRGFQADDDELKSFRERKVNPLQLWQCNQDTVAMLKGFDTACDLGQLSQLFPINDDNGNIGIFRPTADFKIPVNLMMSAWWNISHSVSLGLHLPYYVMELSNVKWFENNNVAAFENGLIPNMLQPAQTLGGLKLGGWKRSGIGDLVLQMMWARDYPQAKPLLKCVRPNVRFGIDFPTGEEREEDLLLGFPFGNDKSWGLRLAGGLDLTFGSFVRGGLDVELLYLFGNKRCRRIRTDLAQTDLLFLTKLPAFKEFGLTQQFNLYLESCGFVPYLSAKINFQHLKHNDDKFYVDAERFDPLIFNNAENLQEWSTNSLIFALNYNGFNLPYLGCPDVSVWYKWGISGKRSLLANTAGARICLSF